MTSNPNPPQVTWRVLLPLVIIGVILKFVFPLLSTYIIAALMIFALVVFYRKVFITGFVAALNRGRANPYIFSEDYEKAVEFGTEQIAKHPKDIVARLTRSTAYIHLGNLEAARADCDAALVLDPKSVYTLNNRAVISLQEDNLPAALADVEQAINMQPDNPILLYGRGVVYARMGKDEAAKADFDEAIEIEPDQAVTYVGRGCLGFKQGDLGAALEDFQEAHKLSPVTHQFNAALAVAEYAAGETLSAQKRWQALPTRYTRYNDPDWQRRVLCWPEAMTEEAGKLVAWLGTLG
jgi:tetratricopeptide (TPR) repeat protein